MPETKDIRSNRKKIFDLLACDAVAKLRQASDAGLIATPDLVVLVQEDVAKMLERVHYGFVD
jgi:hypothetical protein